MKCILCCAVCCVRCFESLIEYLNITAYAYMAISSDSFCTSAWHGFLMTVKHAAQYEVAITLAGWFVLMGKLMITCANCAIFYLVSKYAFNDYLSSVWGPIATLAVASMVTAHLFLCLFDEAIVATLHCMSIDMELNKGEVKFGSPSFHEKLASIYGDKHEEYTRGYQKVYN